MTRVLVVDDKQMMRDSVTAMLARAGYSCVAAENGTSALELIARHRPSAVLTDLRMPEMDGIALLQEIRRVDARLPVVLMTAYADVDTAVRALKLGAFDYLRKPFEGDELIATVRRAVEHAELLRENEALHCADSDASSGRALIGDSEAMARLREQIDRIAASQGTALITGESGTGKEIVAHRIHQHSGRSGRVMLAVNCAALNEALLESELFGHEKGAYTGADRMRKGRFELADGGTLLLDEISEISPTLQAKLLRVLQERQFERVGSSATMDVDVRVIATTNRDLASAVKRGEFRQDLLYRLNVLPVHLPPLRERREDIASLAEHFLSMQAKRDGREPRRFDAGALSLLDQYDWPGNVRELENICERAAVLASGSVIGAATIAPWLGMGDVEGARVLEPRINQRTLEEFEREVIVHTLEKYSGHRQRTAVALGIGVRTLGLKLKKWKEMNLVASTL